MKKEKVSWFEKKVASIVEQQLFISYIMYKELCEFNGLEFNLENFLYNYSTIAKEIHQECYQELSIEFHQVLEKVNL